MKTTVSPRLIFSNTASPLALGALALCALLVASHDASAQRRGGSVDRSYEGARGGSISAQGDSYGRYRSGSVEAQGPRGGTYDASGTQVGRYSMGSVNASGANGGSYSASGTQVGRYSTGSVNATGAYGRSYSASGESFNGYRAGYVYGGGVYRPANIAVNSLYVAPVGVYAGLSVYTQPYYVTYPVYATYPVETAVQVQLAHQGFYNGPIDGIVDKATSQAISAYQNTNGLVVTGAINKPLLVSLGVVRP